MRVLVVNERWRNLPAQAETQPPPVIDLADHQVRRRQILGGLTSEYQIAA